MKKILTILKNWFEKNGMLKVIIAFLITLISILLVRYDIYPNIFSWVTYISMGYLVLTILIFFIAGIVNTIKDIFKKKQ